MSTQLLPQAPVRTDGAVSASLALIRANWGAFRAANLLFFGLVLAGFVISAIAPDLQRIVSEKIQIGLEHGSLRFVTELYRSGNVPLAALATFVVNSVLGAFVLITLPCLLVPFSGLLVGIYRAVLWGLALSPTNPGILLTMIPHSVVLLLEGEAYVMAMFGCLLWGKWVVNPRSAGMGSPAEGWLAGWRANVRLYSIILPLLAVSAIYESVEVILMMTVAGRLRG
jgi:hypothetical protein